MNPRFLRQVRTLFFSIDLISFNIVFIITKLWFSNRIFSAADSHYERLWFFINMAWFIGAFFSNVYHDKYISKLKTFFKKTLQAYVYFMLFAVLYLFFYKQVNISRLFVINILLFNLSALILNRFLYLVIFRYLRIKKYLIRKVLIIGYNELAKKLVGQLEMQTNSTEIVGFCEDEKNINELSHYPIIGTYNNLIEISKLYNINDIYSTIAPENDSRIYKLMLEADQACIHFKLVPDLNLFVRKTIHLDYLGEMPILSLRKEPLEDVSNRIRKRLYDLVVSILVTILILSWMIPLIGLLIWLESRGPVFFIQKRSGRNNKPFNCIKFRSMGISKDAHTKQVVKDDKRITRVGKFLRKTNLDEFPQFLNVLVSQMSVVGPRPHMLKHTEDYSKLLDQYMVRQFLKPGITGSAQVNGYRGETRTLDQMQSRVENDLWYLENWSLWLDTKLILITAFNMIRGEKNAY